MREKWTDERLDDLNQRVSDGFNRVDADLRALRADMNDRFDTLQRLMVQAAVAMSAAFLAGFAAVVGLVATQL